MGASLLARCEARVRMLQWAVCAFECHEAVRASRVAGDHITADFYASCAASQRRHAASFAAIAKATEQSNDQQTP